MNAKPMLNIDAIVFILCTGSLLLALAFGAGYVVGGNHAETEYNVKLAAKREPVPNKCLCGLDERTIRNITYRACKGVKA